MANEVAKKEFTTSLSQWTNEISNLVTRDYEACGVEYDDYSKKCGMEAMQSIYSLVKSNKDITMQNLDTSNLRSVVEHCAALKLNASAYPREVYFQVRKNYDAKSRTYGYEIEMGIEGAGNDSMLRNFGQDVEFVYPYWVVKEGDDFTYPKRKGIEIEPPTWEEKGLSQKCIRVVYPVKLKSGDVIYLISERESVKTNLFAHIRNNLMNETFGICENRFKATDKQKDEIKAKKDVIFDAIRACETVDDMLKCKEALPYISAAWLDTPESMIVRKMCNNATKKFPKNFDSMARRAQIELDETYRESQEEIVENANSVDFVEDGEVVSDVDVEAVSEGVFD